MNSRPSPLKLAFTAVYILCFPTLLFVLAGDASWIEGWIFSAWFIALCTGAITYLYIYDPALLAERYQPPGAGNQKGWDRYVVYALGLGFFVWIAVMPLEARRYRTTAPFPLALRAAGVALLLASSFLFLRSFADNPFLSPLVRIQSERKQETVSKGVYRFVRHPMYLAATLLFFGAPMLLSSCWGAAIGAGLTLLLAGRILGEEKMLLAELEGYRAYQARVRYRLIPYIW